MTEAGNLIGEDAEVEAEDGIPAGISVTVSVGTGTGEGDRPVVTNEDHNDNRLLG